MSKAPDNPDSAKKPPDPDRLFWQAMYRAIMAVAAAIKQYKLGDDVVIRMDNPYK